MDDSRIVQKLEELIKLLKRGNIDELASTVSDISDRLGKIEKRLAAIQENTDRLP